MGDHEKRGISQYKLLKDYKFSAGQLNRLRQNHNVNTYTLDQLCKILDCRIEDVAVYRPDAVPTAPEDASPESTDTTGISEHDPNSTPEAESSVSPAPESSTF